VIENAENPADESWANINAIDDLIEEIICTTDHYIIAAMQGNAGAGGVPFALAADKVLARKGIVFNPHTRKMGLYGSEYWTYLLPGRIGTEKAKDFTEQCLPWGMAVAMEIGLIDGFFEDNAADFRNRVRQSAQKTAQISWFDKLLASKRFQRRKDEAFKPLNEYREAELKEMKKNFYEDNWDYNMKRYCFVHKIHDQSEVEPVQGKDLYSSRRKIYRRRKWEAVHYEE
jgi:putative two-component system hydrogenase maturation factor HypX/HoxX